MATTSKVEEFLKFTNHREREELIHHMFNYFGVANLAWMLSNEAKERMKTSHYPKYWEGVKDIYANTRDRVYVVDGMYPMGNKKED